MSSIDIEEYESLPMIDRFTATHSIPLGTTSFLSSQTPPETRLVAITADTDCRFAISASLDATPACAIYLPDNGGVIRI